MVVIVTLRLLTILSFSFSIRENQTHQGEFASLCGGVRERVTPGSISNPEVKPLIADNTAPHGCGNVGRCHIENSFIIYKIIFLLLFGLLVIEATSID